MIDRLTHRWQREIADQQAAVAAGTLSPDEAYAAQIYPPEFIAAVDAAMARYEAAVTVPAPSDEAIWSAIEELTEAVNEADEETGTIDTIIREDLSQYLDDVLTAAGVDVEALATRRGTDPADLAGEWREW
ncbi:hypothetical protein Ade02nite_68720 [Paractinoplanes deccanensis]|uniref:Uncharacterized protein n=1 Tax=Paractinoplanes deccanensis TaxID=113561 RepID=A0ABQ3YDY4_9ACTN|nr:hypothetical protein [Actinoplanes deccanensis]GID78231.1 hypothetical protein Ade02nite_68720 [Actinoplanes deccanensis]